MSLNVNSITAKVVEQRLKDNFTQATQDCYWHYAAKMQAKETAYQSEKTNEMLTKLGAKSINQVSAFGWSPLHVAAMTGNAAAARYFLSKGALPSAKDEDGNTPAFYCALMNHPDILEILAPKEKKIEFQYRANSHDFGIQIEELLFTMPNNNKMKKSYRDTGIKIDHYAKNLAVIAEKEGFKLTFSRYQFCVRDLLIRLPDGSIVSPSTSEKATSACERAGSKAFIEKSSAAFCTSHTFFHGHMGAGLKEISKGVTESKERFGHQNTLRFYMEGGNHYYATNAEGKQKLLMGEEHLAIAVNQMRLDKAFEDPYINVASLTEKIEKGLTIDKIRKGVQEMYSQGLLKSTEGAEKGLISAQELKQVRTLEEAIEQKFYRPLTLSDAQILGCKKLVARYLAQKEIAKELMGKYFNVSEKDVHFIPQAGYHLDTFMRPGPNGSFFIQDYGCSIELLETIKKEAEELELKATDREILERYIQTAKQLQAEIGPLLASAVDELKKAGFLVIPTPGLFYDSMSATKICNVNFLNAISGWSAKTGAFYYIAAGASVGDKLGKALMDGYTKFLQSHQKDLHVYFTGHNPQNPSDFTEAMSWWNRPGSQAGPHCFSLELKTKSKSFTQISS